MSQMLIPTTERVCCPIWASQILPRRPGMLNRLPNPPPMWMHRLGGPSWLDPRSGLSSDHLLRVATQLRRRGPVANAARTRGRASLETATCFSLRFADRGRWPAESPGQRVSDSGAGEEQHQAKPKCDLAWCPGCLSEHRADDAQ